MRAIGIAAALWCGSATAQIYSPLLDLRNSFTLRTIAEFTAYRLDFLERSCADSLPDQSDRFGSTRRRLTEHMSRTDALIVKSRTQAERRVGDVVEDWYNRSSASHQADVQRFRISFDNGTPKEGAACKRIFGAVVEALDEMDDMVPSVEENTEH
ncbi:hypothetical protein EEB15_15705 [Ramlibacter sp. WS9]|nr:hypothetical protein EEB15_15705 [Ramlibacter sp. WS9]